MLTILFSVCNTVYLGHVMGEIYDYTTKEKDPATVEIFHNRREFMMSYITGVIAPFINAAFNPVILILRGNVLVVFLKTKIKGHSANTSLTITSAETEL